MACMHMGVALGPSARRIASHACRHGGAAHASSLSPPRSHNHARTSATLPPQCLHLRVEQQVQQAAELPPSMQKLVGAFQMVPDPMARYKQLLFYAAKLPAMAAEDHTPENKVEGCVSQVGGLRLLTRLQLHPAAPLLHPPTLHTRPPPFAPGVGQARAA